MERQSADDVDWDETDHGSARFQRKHLSSDVDHDDLGCSIYELPPGGAAWPFHYHTANAEAVYVLDGEGVVRTPDGEEAIEAGDYLVFPPTEEGGHRLRNDGDEPLRYLAMSTMRSPDVLIYPDSEKVGVYAGAPPGGRSERIVDGYYHLDDDVDYWEGEE